MSITEPVFVIELRDGATGRMAAVRLTREQALLPLEALIAGVIRRLPEHLVAEQRLAPATADTLFRLQDLIFPVEDSGALSATPYHGMLWRHGREGFPLDPNLPAAFERSPRQAGPDLLVLPVEADRRDLGYDRNWHGFHARRHHRFGDRAARLSDQALPGGILLDGAAAEQRLIKALAFRIWRADFENYSRFRPPALPLKTGDETVDHILSGAGGVCTEKVLALKYLTDAHGLDSQVIFAGPNTSAPLPARELRTMLDELATYDFTYARRYMRYWDHVALEYRLSDGSCLLVDPSNGNTPFLCAPAAPYLDGDGPRRGVPVTMLALQTNVTYHRIPRTLGLDFMFAWETWISDVDLMQVFDNQLGLLVSEDFYVTVTVWGSATKRRRGLHSWRAYAAEHRLALGWAGDGVDGTEDEDRTVAVFRALHPDQAAACEAALPGLARRYRAYILARHGIDKPFGVDMVVLDRRSINA